MTEPNVGLYTAIYGNYNTPKPVPAELQGRARLLTDNVATAHKAEAMGWEPEVTPSPYLDMDHDAAKYGDPAIVIPMLSHKYWKCHPTHAMPEYDISIWIDGSMEIVVPNFVGLCLNALGEDDWAMMPHPARTCIYPEAAYSATLTWRYDAPSINAQAEHYAKFFPANQGLIATGFNVRRHNAGVIEMGEQWWTEILNWSHQDQISLPVLRWLMPEVRTNLNLPWHQWLTHWPHG